MGRTSFKALHLGDKLFAKHLSDAANKVRQRDFQSNGDPHQSVYRDVFFSPLHSTDVRRIEVRLLRKFLLAHMSPLAISANILAQNSPMLWEGTHGNNPNKKRGKRLTDIPAILSLPSVAGGDRHLSHWKHQIEFLQTEAM
jgi:hypothetical protein